MTVMLAIKLADQEENQSAFCCAVQFEPFIQKEPTGHHSLGGKHTCNSCRRDGQLKEDTMSRDADLFNGTTCCPNKKKKFPQIFLEPSFCLRR